jgi:hypothetical protein
MQWFEKPPRILLGLAVAWLVAFIVLFSDAGVPFPAWIVVAAALVMIAAVWFARLIAAFATKTGDRRPIRIHLRYWILIPAILVGALVLGGSSTLLTARVYFSSSALTQSKVAGGADDRWIGLFHVRESSQVDNERRFLTNECGVVDTCGIIYSPDVPPKNRGEDSFTPLYGPWWHWYQSW